MRYSDVIRAGKGVHAGGRTIIPVVSRRLIQSPAGGFVSVEPVWIVVVEEGVEYYFRLSESAEKSGPPPYGQRP